LCGEQTVFPIIDPYFIKITKNTGEANPLILFEEYKQNFGTGLLGVCPVVKYEFFFSGSFQKLPVAFKEGENIFINSTLPSNLFEYEFSAVTIRAFTDEEKYNDFRVVPVIGCFFEQNIQKTVDNGEEYDMAIALPVVKPDNSSTFYYQEEIKFDIFETEITDCFASVLKLCADAACNRQINEPYLNFTSNPTVKSEQGFPIATLNVDKTVNIYRDIFIYGSTLDPAVNAAYKIKLATCGDVFRFSYAASDPTGSLTTILNFPDA
jgi:hypothetical protein